jgi:hypothetical protein
LGQSSLKTSGLAKGLDGFLVLLPFGCEEIEVVGFGDL